MKRIGVLTSGGDCSGINATLKAIVEEAYKNNIRVTGFLEGYNGLVNNLAIELTPLQVSGILQRGGTILMTSRCEEFMQESGFKKALKTLEEEKIEGLIVIGGDGSLRGAKKLAESGIVCVGIPESIDNDIYGTDMALGVDTALNIITNAIDIIRDTASSHKRAFVIETMGRESGYLALMSAMASGAEAVLIPEVEYDIDSIMNRLKQEHERGRKYSIVVVAEGVKKTQEVTEKLKKEVGFDTRVTILGHIQRGGNPSVFDRTLGMRLGIKAVQSLINKKFGMVGLQGSDIKNVAFDVVFSNKKVFSQMMLEFARLKSR
ncbi:MAG: ATP-dependent 6-phosphofructokinase [Desulfurella sp.]|jgi:6-phosphofructokinase 1|uniref:ATP-dependent 6-phosphofructokinase n=2 Tax=Desulfurella TaxID=33001 RepID=A0A1G6N4X3_9BACT|nr:MULTISPECIES: ATP-dependent 6-phosphofructokinase [Desulfurella]AHF97599.1 6-phosphofructokinase [Desulfurella acetivorans A63]PMP93258.1 MAG: 6-phosphofructokinase [Desulfurella sp.]SDC62892.1 6-phosphofructokinase [Desulfurella multipotens]HEX13766.1 6-phosphofructokinase [Desulfurella acetivorans]